jgi:NAD(P)H-quinone oxidoreductase subunit 5
MAEFLTQTGWWVPLYGILGSLMSIPWAIGVIRRTGHRPAAYLNIIMTGVALIHSTIAFVHLSGRPHFTMMWEWLKLPAIDISFALEFSGVSVGAMVLISGLSLLAQIFALGYMEKDWALARFYALMSFFQAAMTGLVISNSLLLSYGLLEMLTLSTYLLVGFWYAQPLVVTAARDSFLTKRVGDILLLMAVVAVGSYAGSWNFPDLYDWAENPGLDAKTLNFLGLGLISASIGKCAQIPLNLWLDEAMEGPNPASILRNSVVVSAGAYILFELQPLIVLSPLACQALVAIGSTTAIICSLIAIAQIDIKRALSHTTSAYLGLVFIAIGFQWTGFALLLLLAHGLAKALMFMSTGSVILTTNNQDLTQYGGLGKKMPLTMLSYLIGAASSIGLIPLGCFWAFREGIASFWGDRPVAIGLILAVNVLSGISTMRIFRLVFLGTSHPKARRAPEVGWQMAVPMVTLGILNLLFPAILARLDLIPDMEYINPTAVGMLAASGLVGCAIGCFMPLARAWVRPMQPQLRFLQDFLAYDLYLDRGYQKTIVAAVSNLSRLNVKLDRYIVDGFVNGVGFATIFSGESLRYISTGKSQGYVLTILVGLVALGAVIIWPVLQVLNIDLGFLTRG